MRISYPVDSRGLEGNLLCWLHQTVKKDCAVSPDRGEIDDLGCPLMAACLAPALIAMPLPSDHRKLNCDTLRPYPERGGAPSSELGVLSILMSTGALLRHSSCVAARTRTDTDRHLGKRRG